MSFAVKRGSGTVFMIMEGIVTALYHAVNHKF